MKSPFPSPRMVPAASVSLTAGIWAAMCALSSCGEAVPEKGGSPAFLAIEARLNEVKPLAAAYLGIDPAQISGFWPGPAYAINDSAGRKYRLHPRTTYPDAPRVLPRSRYELRAEVGVIVGQQPAPQYTMVCYYDAERDRWLIDTVHGGPDAVGTDSSVTPAPSWDPNKQ